MLSIIMPVYNTVSFLPETIQSVLEQTYRDFELILVDDGSTDGSAQLCDDFAEKDSRVRVIHKPNGGVASARNAGLQAAKGDYIGWVDSDDIISPVMFEMMVSIAQEYRADIVQCSHTRNQELIETQKTFVDLEVLNCIESLKRIYRSHYTNSLSLCTKVLRKELFETIRFTEGTAFEDDEIVPKLLELGKVNVFFETKLYCYVKREQSIITAPKVSNIQALTAHLEKRMLRFKELDEHLYALGVRHFYQYIKGKICEKAFWGTAVQKQAVALMKKYLNIFWKIANCYDRAGILLLYCGNRGVQVVANTEFEPLQELFRRIKRL